jgi:hypothetical protein
MAAVASLQPWIRPYAAAAVSWAAARGGVLTSAFRSYTEQLYLWNNRSRNPFPVAPPGRSFHNYGRAFDINASEDVLATLGAWWKSLGGTWSESDPIHFQA